jgi:hypothetical protein
MPKTFAVKIPLNQPPESPAYVIVTCPKCDKMTYGVAGQKGKKCPVCRHSYAMPDKASTLHFQTSEEACRHIQSEEAKRAGRLDFVPATSSFTPAERAPTIARTIKKISEARTMDTQFSVWVRQFFRSITGNSSLGVPTTIVVAAAARAGFAGADILVERAETAGLLLHPKPYSVWLNARGENKKT